MITLMAIFILSLLIANSHIEKRGYKQDIIKVDSPYYIKFFLHC